MNTNNEMLVCVVNPNHEVNPLEIPVGELCSLTCTSLRGLKNHLFIMHRMNEKHRTLKEVKKHIRKIADWVEDELMNIELAYELRRAENIRDAHNIIEAEVLNMEELEEEIA